MASFKSDRVRKPYSRPAPRVGNDGQWLHDRAQDTERPTGPRKTRPALGFGNPTEGGLSRKIEVSNLHYEVTVQDLTSIFGQIGTLVREPHIWYDASGRSKGIAVITFETSTEATRAKMQFNGLTAKGQVMAISYYNPANHPQRSSSAPLISRIQKGGPKGALADRISRDDLQLKSGSSSKGSGPIRTRQVRGPGGPGGAGRPPRGKKLPPTAEDLDKELDAFMGDGSTPAPNGTAAAGKTLPQDVDMA